MSLIIDNDIQKRLAAIKMIILDVDGVMTDATMYLDNNGVETKGFNIRDGFGMIMAKKMGIELAIITGRTSNVVKHRADDLGIEELHMGFIEKKPVCEDILERLNLKPVEAAYMGDDLFDIPLLRYVGFSAAPADAHELVKAEVDWVSSCKGGRGAVRELIEMTLKARGLWERALIEIAGW